MAHTDGNLAGSEGNPVVLVVDDCSFGRYFHCLLDGSRRLVLCEEPELYNNSTETKDGSMATKSKLRKIVATPDKLRSKVERKLLERARKAAMAPALGKSPASWESKKAEHRPATEADLAVIVAAERKRERKAAKLAAQGFGTVSFLMPDDPFLMAAAEGGFHASSN